MTEFAITEQWHTREALDAARERFEESIPGWQKPAVWAIGRVTDEDTVVFERINVAWSFLPAVVLATICGHVSGSASYALTVDDLDHAIAMLAPADAATFMPHPSLAALRALRADMDGDDLAIVVYVGDLSDHGDDVAVRALLDQLSDDQLDGVRLGR